MKKIIIIIASVLVSSCFLWNASLDNVVQKYRLNFGVQYNSADYRLLKSGNSITFCKTNDYDPANPGGNTETTDGEFFYREGSVSISGYSLGSYYVGSLTTADGTLLLKDDTYGGYILSASNPAGAGWLYETSLDAVKGDYGYRLDAGSPSTLEVYDVSGWLDAAAVSIANSTTPPNLDTTAQLAASFAVPGLSNGSLGENGMLTNDDTLVFWYKNSDGSFSGIVLIDITAPGNPGNTRTRDYSDLSESQPELALSGDNLYIYCSQYSPAETTYNPYFNIVDISPAVPVDNNISTDMEGFIEEINWPHCIKNNLAYVFKQDEGLFRVWDLSNPSGITETTENVPSLFDSGSNGFSSPNDSFTVAGDKIILAAGNNVEVFQYSAGALTHIVTGYVGLPLLGAYKFPDDPYIYALGHDSINVVSVVY